MAGRAAGSSGALPTRAMLRCGRRRLGLLCGSSANSRHSLLHDAAKSVQLQMVKPSRGGQLMQRCSLAAGADAAGWVLSKRVAERVACSNTVCHACFTGSPCSWSAPPNVVDRNAKP